MKNKFVYLTFILFFLNACQTLQDGIAGNKNRNSDEFLIEKKNPLEMPPEFGSLPEPAKKVNIIDKTSPTKCELKVAPRTKSSVFIMPMLSGSKELYFYNTLFLNCFIATEDHPNSIILLYRFSGSALFLKFEQALKKFTTFKDMIDPSPHHVMFVFDIPTKYKDDYNKFILGKYSHFSPELKDAIFKFHKTDMHSSLGQILYKSEKRRLRLSQNLGMEIPPDMELFDIPDAEDEIYNPKIYINE